MRTILLKDRRMRAAHSSPKRSDFISTFNLIGLTFAFFFNTLNSLCSIVDWVRTIFISLYVERYVFERCRLLASELTVYMSNFARVSFYLFCSNENQIQNVMEKRREKIESGPNVKE